MPASRPMASVGAHCHELRVTDAKSNWRLMYRIDSNAVVVLEVFAKKTEATPKAAISVCQRRIREYDRDRKDEDERAKAAGEQRMGRRKR